MIRPKFNSQNKIKTFINKMHLFWYLITSENVISLGDVFNGKIGKILNFLNIKQYCVISSCAHEAPLSVWQKIGNGRLCNNCNLKSKNIHICKDNLFQVKFNNRKIYSSGEITLGYFPNAMVPNQIVLPFISCDKKYFNPDIKIPKKFKINKRSDTVYIIHSYFNDQVRIGEDGLNKIKGTKFIINAIDRLKQEGFKIKLINPTNMKQKDLRYVQVQCDICVEELNYGWWGSTPLECASLGVPTIVFMDKHFKDIWKKNFPELSGSIPFVNSSTDEIYKQLKKLCKSESLRNKIKNKSLKFSKLFLDPEKNAKTFLRKLNIA